MYKQIFVHFNRKKVKTINNLQQSKIINTRNVTIFWKSDNYWVLVVCFCYGVLLKFFCFFSISTNFSFRSKNILKLFIITFLLNNLAFLAEPDNVSDILLCAWDLSSHKVIFKCKSHEFDRYSFFVIIVIWFTISNVFSCDFQSIKYVSFNI